MAKILSPQVAFERRSGKIEKVENTLFDAVTAAQDSCKTISKFSQKRIMSVGIIRKNGTYKPMRCITIDQATQPPKTYA